ncbi:uncharacterized protein LOC128965487 [Oppia nitens]|uniref:uncharacterized protein LOC128965487 n=1 Tax=Oppia nitens TaxID=1686743 RepID=UPI0023DB3D0C|nr:uncharacterized protein LOC128965487 [Oppia nitens]
MLRKVSNSINCRLLITKRYIGSQVVKPNERLVKNNTQNGQQLATNYGNNELNKNEEQMEIQVKEMLDQVIKKDKEMDREWQLNVYNDHKKLHNVITHPSSWVHQRLDLFMFLVSHFKPDWSLSGWKKRLKNYIHYREKNMQQFNPKRHADLGPELAIANFVIDRGGKVKFTHSPNSWATKLSHFPRRYDPRYRLLSVDSSNLKLRYESLDNFVEMYSLQELDLSDNLLDDWACDKLSRLFRNSTLHTLNLSNNPMITHRGIEKLHWIRSLNKLTITGTAAANYPFLDLLVLSFNDLIPDCQIIT